MKMQQVVQARTAPGGIIVTIAAPTQLQLATRTAVILANLAGCLSQAQGELLDLRSPEGKTGDYSWRF
jgi:hypothetical protein